MRQMPEGGIRKRPNTLDAKRLYSKIHRHRENFYLLDWYAVRKRGIAFGKRICDKFGLKQLQDNCSRGATPGLIDPARGAALGNRVPLPYDYGMIHDYSTLGDRRRTWKPLKLSPVPEPIQTFTESYVRRKMNKRKLHSTRLEQVKGAPSPYSVHDGSDEESEDSRFPGRKHPAGSIVKHEGSGKDARPMLYDKDPTLEAQLRQRITALGDTQERLITRPSDAEEHSEDYLSIQDRTPGMKIEAKREHRKASISLAIATIGPSEEDQDLDLSEGEACLDPRVKGKTPEMQSPKTSRPSEHNQHNDFDDFLLRQAGQAEQENKNGEDLPSDKTPSTSNQSPKGDLSGGARRIPSNQPTTITFSNNQRYKIQTERKLVYTVNGVPRLRPQLVNRVAKNTNRAELKHEAERRSPSLAVPEGSNEDNDSEQPCATIPLLAQGRRRQELQKSARRVLNSSRDDKKCEKVEQSPPLMAISSDEDISSDQIHVAAASTRSAQETKPRYNLRNRVSADHNKPSSRSSPLFFSSGDESGADRPQRTETSFVVQARKARSNRVFSSDTSSGKFVPIAITPSDSDDEIPDIRPRAKRPRRGIIEPTEQIPREPNKKCSIEVRVDSLNVDANMEDMPLTAIGELDSASKARVGPSGPREDVAISETKTLSAPSPLKRNRATGDISMDTVVEKVIELRSRISTLERRESLTSKSLGEQADRVAIMAIELRARSNRFLDEVASLHEAVDRYNGLR